MSSRHIVVFGHRGQDGRLLTESSLKKGISVLGISRTTVDYFSPGLFSPVKTEPRRSDKELLESRSPEAVYYLAANHSSSESNQALAVTSADIETYFTSNFSPYSSFLEEAWNLGFEGSIFFASSSQVYGTKSGEILCEESPYNPGSLYGMAKAQATWLGRKYREEKGLHVYTGILFNHESHLRSPRFLTRKIVEAALRIADGSREMLRIGNLSALVDWSLASDFVEGFQRLMETGMPDEYIFASGVRHSVQDFTEEVFGALGLDWRNHVEEDSNLLQNPPVQLGLASTAKLKATINWDPDTTLERLVRNLLFPEEDIG